MAIVKTSKPFAVVSSGVINVGLGPASLLSPSLRGRVKIWLPGEGLGFPPVVVEGVGVPPAGDPLLPGSVDVDGSPVTQADGDTLYARVRNTIPVSLPGLQLDLIDDA